MGGRFLGISPAFPRRCIQAALVGAEAQTLDFSFSALSTQPRALPGVSLLPARHHSAPRAGQAGSAAQTAGGGQACGSDEEACHLPCIQRSGQTTWQIRRA